MPQPTVHRHLNLLETGCLLVRVPPYAANPTTGLVKTRRLFWSDCGLAAWLAGIRSEADLAGRLDQGFWLEQTLFQSLHSWRALDPTGRRIYCWRDRSREVDFLLENHGVFVAIEVKTATRVDSRDAAGIEALRAGMGKRLRRAAVLYAGGARPLGPDVYALPWGWLVA